MALFKIDGQKLTAIADAIRVNTGSEATMTPDEMAAKVESVHTSGYNLGLDQGMQDGRALGHQEGYTQGFTEGRASKPFEVHKIKVDGDRTSGTYMFLENNEFIKENYNKPGFSVQLISLVENTSGPAVGYAYNGNRQFQNDACGVMIVLSSSNGNNYRTTTGNCYTISYNNIPYVDKEGNVKMQNSSTNGTLKAGDYLIILSVAEVEQ